MNAEERKTGTRVETISFTLEEAGAWKVPGFQRGKIVNDNIRKVAKQIAEDGGVIPGIITFGIFDKKEFLIDGQQRREAFLLSGCKEGYADTRYYYAENMADMASEYVKLNRHLVSMKPDDILRGMELSLPCLQKIRKECPFVGYDQVRRNDRSPVVSMSGIIRCWAQSGPEVPGSTGISSSILAETMSADDAHDLCSFLSIAMKAWGRDREYIRLWSSINLTLCMWLYRRLVISVYSSKTQKIDGDQFCRCMMALSADSNYVDWLLGRHLGERDRAPAYARIKTAFVSRLAADTGKKMFLPAPAWAHGSKR